MLHWERLREVCGNMPLGDVFETYIRDTDFYKSRENHRVWVDYLRSSLSQHMTTALARGRNMELRHCARIMLWIREWVLPTLRGEEPVDIADAIVDADDYIITVDQVRICTGIQLLSCDARVELVTRIIEGYNLHVSDDATLTNILNKINSI